MHGNRAVSAAREDRNAPAACGSGAARTHGVAAVKKLRLLELLQLRFPDVERKELHARVLCGEIRVEGATERDPGRKVAEAADVRWSGEMPVGRGSDKLAAALDAFRPAVRGTVVLDAGSSTGGFTQQLLQRGVSLVYAVDVGTNQLAWKLRRDERVRVMENTNVLDLKPDHLQPRPAFAVCDVSFRGLLGVARHIAALTEARRVIALAKPQFERQHFQSEIGGERAFRGVVEDDEGMTIVQALSRALLADGFRVGEPIPSPVRGRRGNLEYFLDLTLVGEGGQENESRPNGEPM